jgi:HSP20 family protein
MPVVKYSPFVDTDEFPSGLRLFQDTVNRLFSDQATTRPWAPSVDIFETDNDLVLKADVPGVDQKDIDIRIENGTLSAQGRAQVRERREEQGFPSAGAKLRFIRTLLHSARHRGHVKTSRRTSRAAC